MNLLNFPDWQITKLTEAATHYFIHADYQPHKTERSRCSFCFPDVSFVQKYGIRRRTFRDAPVRGKIVSGLLSIQKYKCLGCGAVFQDNIPELEENSPFTKRLISYIERESIKKNFLTVARETGVSDSTVRGIFERFIKRNEERILYQTPTILGIDDVYISGVARCILTDIQRRKVIDILPKRDMPTVYRCLTEMKNKKDIKVVTMDMSRPFFNSVMDAFPHAQIVIDTFHVQRMINQAINVFLRSLRDSLNLSRRRMYMRDRFLLMKRSYNLSHKEKETLLKWRHQLPVLNEVYQLKEDFLALWRLSSRKKAEGAFKQWRDKIPDTARFAFLNILTSVENWHHEIFNYFDYKVTNAFTESANNLIKQLQKQGRGCSFRVIRAKIIYRKKD